MTTATVTLAEAQATLKQAQDEVARENRRKDEEAFRAAQAEGRKFKDQYEALRREFRQAEVEVAQHQAKLAIANNNIDRHFAAKPDPLDFPLPREEAAWESRRSKLVGERDAIARDSRADTACAQLRLAAIEAFNRMENQRRIVRNLREKLEDPNFPNGGPKGGVSSVQAGGISVVTGF